MLSNSDKIKLQPERSWQPQDVLQFWFPSQPDPALATIVRQWQRWFRGGADAEIVEQFGPLLEQARRGELAAWTEQPQSRLALIIVLDQFSRTIYRGRAEAFAQDPQACALALEGIDLGHYAALTTVWEKTFFLLPLGHSENLSTLETAVALAEALVQEGHPDYRELLAFSAEQARRHRDVIARFGRHPHRNEVLGRPSTAEEMDYLANGQLIHQRSLPLHLSRTTEILQQSQ